MRGARPIIERYAPTARIIPAYAGSTQSAHRCGLRAWDHPRVCGEHAMRIRNPSRQPGSSPRMRGALTSILSVHAAGRIIPAYAGSTSPSRSGRPWSRDHPRVCGEHAQGQPSRDALGGSSPRMRGALPMGAVIDEVQRIIPAYAGSTYGLNKLVAALLDHPRVCGEHTR